MEKNIRAGTSEKLSDEAQRMKKAYSFLLSLADCASRNMLEYLDAPRELRKTALSLKEGAATLERMASLEKTYSWAENFLIHFRNEVYRLKMLLYHKLCDDADEERQSWPQEYNARLAELEGLLDLGFQLAGELAEEEYFKETVGHYRHRTSYRPASASGYNIAQARCNGT